MVIRTSLVSNSSSTSFVITNKSPITKYLREFVVENIHLVDEFNKAYNYTYTHEEAIKSVEGSNTSIDPGENIITFGDEQGTVIGHIYDYILRDGGESRSFKWKFQHYQR